MKNLSLLAFVLGIMNATAQNQVKIPVIDPNQPNPFAKIGEYEEVLGFHDHMQVYHENDTLELHGFGYDPISGKIVYIKPDEKSEQIISGADTVEMKPTTNYRWLSTDPVVKANESPYAGFAGNPIMFVDPDGRDNIVYLVVLPSAKEKLTKTEIQDIVNAANRNYEALGLNTRVALYNREEGFDPQHMDKTDSYAILGSVDEVKKTFESEKFKEGQNVDTKAWTGGASYPETSSNPGSGIAIDVDGLKGFAKEANATIGEAGGFIINHGSGHNATLGHEDDLPTSFMAAGAYILSFVNQHKAPKYIDGGELIVVDNPEVKQLKDFFKPENNQKVIPKMKERFGTNKASDNYYLNLRKKDGAPPVNKGQTN